MFKWNTWKKTIQFIQYSQTSWADVEFKVRHWIKWGYSFCNETMNTLYALCGTTLNFIDSKCTNLLSTHNNQFSYQCLFFTLSHSNGIFPIKWEKLNNIRLFCNFIISFEFGIPISNQSSKTSSWQYYSFYVHCPSSNVKMFRLPNVLHSWKRPKTNFYLSTSTRPAFLVHKRINANIAIA